MKRMILITLLASAAALSACGGADQIVSKSQSDPLGIILSEQVEPTYFSSRSSVDLLSF
ncbi:hypothetical protein [Tateyamaria sp. SN6-1]|uniref:hypothetical protein n=1 Tax=Tateyamaria sp. SN6-1 TaxID=3092148 RepID=UPI0039F5D298